MDEYINRTAIVQKIKNRYMPRSVDPYSVNLYDAGVNCGLDLALGLIDSAIAEDVLPVRHAHWVAQYDQFAGKYNSVEGYKCSKCGGFSFYQDNYCADCGAKMDEAKDNG